MPRVARVVPPQSVFHIISRGNNHMELFHDDDDFKRYLDLLYRYKLKHKFKIYHYCLMPNHTHFILETSLQGNLSGFMKSLNLSYFNYYKKRYGYSGHMWQDRFKSIIIEKDTYLLACGVYIEYNPVKAKIAKHPSGYKYSSFNFYVAGEKDRLLDKDPFFDNLSTNNNTSRKMYKDYFSEAKQSIAGNRPVIGSSSFVKKMKEQYGVREANKRGRPKMRWTKEDEMLSFMQLSDEEKIKNIIAFKNLVKAGRRINDNKIFNRLKYYGR